MKKSEFADELGHLMQFYKCDTKRQIEDRLIDLAAAFCFTASKRGLSKSEAIEFLYDSLDAVRIFNMERKSSSAPFPNLANGVFIVSDVIGEA